MQIEKAALEQALTYLKQERRRMHVRLSERRYQMKQLAIQQMADKRLLATLQAAMRPLEIKLGK